LTQFTQAELKVLRKIINIEHIGPLHGKIHFGVGVRLINLVTGVRVLLEEVLMPRQYVFHQAILVSGSMRAKCTFELRIDPALEIVMTLQVVFVLVSLAASDAGVLVHRGAFRIR
jgi:hypothetical protein